MVTGAASAEAALLLIDAHEGVQEQSRRHGYLLHLLGVDQVAVLVNKMDLVGWSADRFGQVAEDYRAYLEGLGVDARVHRADLGARGRQHGRAHGPDVVVPGPERGRTCWTASTSNRCRPTGRCGCRSRTSTSSTSGGSSPAGSRAGTLQVGDEVVFSPSNKTARIKTSRPGTCPRRPRRRGPDRASASRSTEQIFVERGEVMSHLEHAPIESNVFKARLFWLGRSPLEIGKSYTLKLGTLEAPVTVEAIERVIDTSDLSSKPADADRAQRCRRGRAAHQAPAGARRAPGQTRSPAASSWSRITCRSAAASSRWRAIPTSAG